MNRVKKNGKGRNINVSNIFEVKVMLEYIWTIDENTTFLH